MAFTFGSLSQGMFDERWNMRKSVSPGLHQRWSEIVHWQQKLFRFTQLSQSRSAMRLIFARWECHVNFNSDVIFGLSSFSRNKVVGNEDDIIWSKWEWHGIDVWGAVITTRCNVFLFPNFFKMPERRSLFLLHLRLICVCLLWIFSFLVLVDANKSFLIVKQGDPCDTSLI